MKLFIISACLLVSFLGGAMGQVLTFGKGCPRVDVQKDFNLNEYMGKWYEMSRLFASYTLFSHCVTANYTLLPDGTVKVNNSGYNMVGSPDTPRTAIGLANIVDMKEPAKLSVRFAETELSRGDYWVLETDYTSYSVVWTCTDFKPFMNSQNLWILSRKQEGISKEKMNKLRDLLRSYDIDDSQLTAFSHTRCPEH